MTPITIRIVVVGLVVPLMTSIWLSESGYRW